MSINVNTVSNKVTHVFPVGLYAHPDLLTEEENDVLLKKIENLRCVFGKGNTTEWMSGEYSPDNCFHISALTEYLEFKAIVERVTQCVNEFATHYGSDEQYACNDAWYNVYTSGRYQEFHMHPYSIFSAVYYVKVPDGAPGTYFKRPNMGSMLPPKNKVRPTPLSMDSINAPPQERTVIIFRSNLQHSVPPATFDGERITIALNFD